MKKTSFNLKKMKVILSAAIIGVSLQVAQAADTIKVGVLHSLSGTMAISETTVVEAEKLAIK